MSGATEIQIVASTHPLFASIRERLLDRVGAMAVGANLQGMFSEAMYQMQFGLDAKYSTLSLEDRIMAYPIPLDLVTQIADEVRHQAECLLEEVYRVAKRKECLIQHWYEGSSIVVKAVAYYFPDFNISQRTKSYKAFFPAVNV